MAAERECCSLLADDLPAVALDAYAEYPYWLQVVRFKAVVRAGPPDREMTAHSLLGASGAYRWLACPGSFKLSQSAPHRPSSIYAATGTAAHQMIEAHAKAGRLDVDLEALGDVVQIEGHAVTIDMDLITGVETMLDYIYRNQEAQVTVETQVALDSYFKLPPPVPMFGTLDAVLVDIQRRTIGLEIVDYKNGAGVTVSPVENPQLLYYAAGALASLAPKQRDWVNHIKLTIVQPHAAGVAPIRSWETTSLDVLMWVDDVLVPGVEACAQPDAPFNAGTWCRFCPVAHACPLLHDAAVKAAQADFADTLHADMLLDDVPGVVHGSLARDLDIAERAQLWIDRVQEFAVEQLKSQVRIPGWGLVPTRPMRKWINESVAGSALQDVAGDSVFERKLRSPAQIEKRFPGLQGLSLLVESVSSGVKLARTSDAGEDFNDGSE